MAVRGQATVTAAQVQAVTTMQAQGIYTETSQKQWNNKTLFNWKVNGEWYGVGDKEPDGVFEGDNISFTFKNGKQKADGSFYKNLVASTVTVVAAGAVQSTPLQQAAASTPLVTTTASYDPSSTQKNIVMQSSLRTAAQLLTGAISSGALTLPASAKTGAKKNAGYDALILAFEKLADTIYLRAINIDGYITKDEAIIDSIEDTDSDDVPEFDDELPG